MFDNFFKNIKDSYWQGHHRTNMNQIIARFKRLKLADSHKIVDIAKERDLWWLMRVLKFDDLEQKTVGELRSLLIIGLENIERDNTLRFGMPALWEKHNASTPNS